MKIKHRIFSSIIFLTMVSASAFTQKNTVNFYGVFSKDTDQNMINVTEDMFYKQLSEITPEAKDLRSNKDELFSSPDDFDNTSLINNFYKNNPDKSVLFITIKKIDEEEGLWNCKITLHRDDEKNFSLQKEYNSYYKILMESKTILGELFEKQTSKQETPQQKTSRALSSISTETLAGTWTGENYVNKIILMRGGRGFVIFNNGASMNINVKVSGSAGSNTVKIIQTSSSNASFFPDIPRKAALELATYAKPIEWNLSYNQDGTLSGTKSTVVIGDSNSAVQAEIPVTWTKKTN